MNKFKNESITDRVVRASAGIFLLAVAWFTANTTAKAVLIVLAIIALFTAITGFCTLYKIFGINTMTKK